MIYPVPKPTKSKSRKLLRNPVPTINDRCYYCGTPYASAHEVYEGSGRRQISIQYKMQVRLCPICHKEVQEHPLQGKDLVLKQEFQKKFEAECGTREEFRRLFGKSYL